MIFFDYIKFKLNLKSSTHKQWILCLNQIKNEMTHPFSNVDEIFNIVKKNIINASTKDLNKQLNSTTNIKNILVDIIATIVFDNMNGHRTHVYRGTLSFYGENLYNLFMNCINYLEKENFYTKEEIQDIKKDIKQKIQDWG